MTESVSSRAGSMADLPARLETLMTRGVHIVDPRQTFLDGDVLLERIYPGVVLYPGTRLHGARTFLAPGAIVGREGPATLHDTVMGAGAVIDSGFVHGAVLLERARVGANAHVREGTLLEEEASTAHCVGLKQTVLLSFVTLGSLINLCDLLVAGGTSREDHSEVGSGFIHFNFTPWGRRGDKATASLVGDVVSGVFLRQPRIFLGGAGGMVGPRSVGYGSIAGAGQVLRRDVPDGRLVVQPTPAVDEPALRPADARAGSVRRRNTEYIAQLYALRAFYRQVRLVRVPAGTEHEPLRVVIEEALRTIDLCLHERFSRLRLFLEERGERLDALDSIVEPPCPLPVSASVPYVDHLAWVQGLSAEEVQAGTAWLGEIAAAARHPAQHPARHPRHP
jgi:hypothetical protein